MKKMRYILLFMFSLLLVNCDTNDDGFYNTVYLNIPNLVSIETQQTYFAGDKIYVNANIDRYLPETGHTELLDLYKSSGFADKFIFTYVLEKKNNEGEWKPIEVNTNQLDIVKGEAVSGNFILGIPLFNPTLQKYEFRVGVPLVSSGEYRLSFGYNSNSTKSVELISQNSRGKLIININSEVSGLNPEGFFNFNVN